MMESKAIKLVVGLGNPGRKYARTRHNLGFMVLDRWAGKAGLEFRRQLKWNALVAEVGGARLLKPETFMNESGWSVAKAARFLKLSPEEILVVYDDAALPLGRMRLRLKGSAGGHNGIKSLIQHLGGEAFPRLKLGIGESQPEGMVGHVLGAFREEEWAEVEKVLASAVEAIQFALSQGVEGAANRFNASSNEQ